MKKLKNTRGITLIALVVTIVVLLILAAVSISMLGGENGIITQAQDSKNKTEQAKVQEIVDLAVNTLISENMGSKDGITPKDIADKINEEYDQYENVYAEDEVNFPTKIIFPEEGDREVEIDLNGSTGGSDNIYDADVSEEDIAPTDIFKYEIISDAETGATSLDSLPTKEARIIGIKEKYCNSFNYPPNNPDTGNPYENTNYEIILEDGTKISDTLVIPYQVEIGGEMYRITEANINAIGNANDYEDGYSLPKVKNIIYPNTIKKIEGEWVNPGKTANSTLINVILSKNMKEIGENAFYGCSNLKNVEIPSSVTSIGVMAFSNCESLTSIEIPNSVTSIERMTFYGCSSLTTVNYIGTMEQWQQISGKDELSGVQIVCSDGTINQ